MSASPSPAKSPRAIWLINKYNAPVAHGPRTRIVINCCTRRAWPFFALLVVLLGAHPAFADGGHHFVDSRAIDPARLLAPPPTDGSDVTRAELDAMLLIQERRSPVQVTLVKMDDDAKLDRFSDALGSAERLRNVPLLEALMRKVHADSSPIIEKAKDAFNRPRPHKLEPRLKPSLELPTSSAYPSGHGTWGYTTALVLADMVPERRLFLMERADEFARNRVIGGVHFPSDVEAGRLLATVIVAFAFNSPQFSSERAAAAKELRAVLGLPATPAPAAAKPKS
jgi:acid phosphatase (class A)